MTTKFDRPLTLDPTQHKEETTLAGLPQTPSGLLQPSKRSHLSSSSKKKTSHLQWFYDLPVRNKQLAGLLASGVISIVGLVGVGTVSTVSSGRNQLFNQAKSELAVTKSYYDIKINQMGFGFRGQSDNAAIVAAAQSHAQGQPLSPTTEEEVKQILRNEIKARNIEYATLVGNDLRIIASANANRVGERFDPSGLVSAVLKNPRQIKTSAIVSWEELQRESPQLPEGFRDRDALIRYTVTPVRAPNSDVVIGVLVSGDIVNGKLSIVEDSLQAFDGGYSAIYLRQSKGKFVLASSLDQAEGEAEATRSNIQLPDLSILERAAAAAGKPVTERMKIGTQIYAIAAEALPNTNGEPTAILVRGTPEKSLNFLLRQSLVLQLVVAALAVVVNLILARMLARAIADPVKQLQQTTEKFALGNRQARAEVTAADEIGQLANTFNQLADSIVASEERLLEHAHDQEGAAKRAQRLNEIILSVRRSLNQEEILNTAVRELRSAVNSDRAIVYLFDENWQGTIVAESVLPGYPVALGAMIADPCFADRYVEKYKQGRVQATENIYAAGLTECHINQLAAFEVKANIVAPILVAGNLLGLLICHQCSGPRAWQESEIDLLRQVATLVGLTIEQANLLEQREQARLQAEALFEEQRQQKEAIQMQLIDLLGHIEGVAQGDLTVRADVTAGEIGTVADFFNSIVESLRQIVTKVKQSAVQVNSSLGENEGAMRLLAEVALQQAEETTRTLNSVEQMTQSIQAVAQSACQAAEVARTASLTAEEGEMAMDLTVQNILSLRETVSQTAKKVKRLGEASQQISKVVSLINQIAMQTNLLAINAGIEAARAGEEGQGFAVVAEEVGALAARSAGATQEIERIVEDIQRETAQVVEAMEQSTTQVVEGTKLVEDTKQSLGQILDVSRQIDQLVQSIFEATVSQVQTAQAVSSLMEEIAQVSEHTSNSSRNVSHSLRQTVEIAQQLQSSVGTFKVS